MLRSYPLPALGWYIVLSLSLASAGVGAPDSAAAPGPLAPAVLPGRGLAEHDFLYTGEWDYRKADQTLYVVRGGRIVWSYGIPIKDATGTLQELGAARMLANGNIVFCRKVGASEITPAKQIVWDFPAPKGTEIHAVEPLGLDRVLLVENGNPAQLLIINTSTGKVEKQLALPTPHPEKPHLQFRRVSLTPAGTFLAAHLDAGKVVEYDQDGHAVWTYATPGPWSAERLANGNTLITSYPCTALEVNPQGQVVWEFSQRDCPQITCFIFQEAHRLPNGNTLICNWCPVHVKNPAQWPGTVQVLEVSPAKAVVWALRSWSEPDLGPASSLQVLDPPLPHS